METDWALEVALSTAGCEVHVLGQVETESLPENVKTNAHIAVHSFKLGDVTEGDVQRSMTDMMDQLGHAHKRLTMLCLDCKGCEWSVLSSMPKTVWKNLDQ